MFRQREDGTVEELPAEDGVLSEDCRFLVKVGPVGEPVCGAPVAASYVIYDNETNEVYFRQAPYDAGVYMAEVQAAGLPLRPWSMNVAEGGPPVAEPPVAIPPVAVMAVEGQFNGEELVSAPVVPDAFSHPPEPVRRDRGLIAWFAWRVCSAWCQRLEFSSGMR